MTVQTDSERTNISDRSAGEAKLADAEPINDGVVGILSNVSGTTLFLRVAGATSIEVEGSPDDGETWYTFTESPVSFDGADETMIHWPYNLTQVRLTADNATVVTAQIREVV